MSNAFNISSNVVSSNAAPGMSTISFEVTHKTAQAQPQLLSIDSILFYVQTRLENLNQEINKRLVGQQKNIELQGLLGKVKDKLVELGIGDGAVDKTDPEAVKYINNLLDDAIAIANKTGDTDTAKQLETEKDRLNRGGDDGKGKDFLMTKDERQTASGSIDHIRETLRGRSEIEMIDVQALIGQRSTSIQLATSMLANMNDAMKGIVGNVGR